MGNRIKRSRRRLSGGRPVEGSGIPKAAPIRLSALTFLAALLCNVGTGQAGTTNQPAPVAGKVRSGTGFFVSPDGFLVTSAHVVDGCAAISVWPRNMTVRDARLIGEDRTLDIALLLARGSVPGFVEAPVRWDLPIGEPVTALGFATSPTRPLAAAFIHGQFTGEGRSAAGAPILTIHGKVPEGASGGLVIDTSGALVGMMIGYYADEPEVGALVPNIEIANFLGHYEILLAPQRDRDRSPAQIDDELKSASMLVQCQPLRERDATQGVATHRR